MKVRICTGTNYCGTDEEEIIEFADGTSDSDLDDYVNELAAERAGAWGTFEILDEEEEEEEE